MDQVGVTGNAFYAGVPAATVAWPKTGGGTNSCTIFNEISKTPSADIAQTRGNDNEILAMRRTNKGYKLRFSAKPIGANLAAALAIMADLPAVMEVLTITCAGDTQVAGTAYVDSATARYTPDGEGVIDFEATKYAGTFVTLS